MADFVDPREGNATTTLLPRPPTTPTPQGSNSNSTPFSLISSPSAASSHEDGLTLASVAARVAATEATLASLQAQVNHLTNFVKMSLPQQQPLRNSMSVFSPFDSTAPSLSAARTSPVPGEPDISALTHQIAALSTSVAQLQRLQSQNGPQLGGVMPPSPSAPNGHAHGPLRHIPPPPLNMINTNTVGGGAGGPLGPPSAGLLSPSHIGRGDGPRTPVSRSFGSSLLNDEPKWGTSPVKYGSNGGRDWPTNGGNTFGGPSAGAGPGGGAAAPGAGIVITKWEHLNLKVELLRSISKYG
jgi:hypothetical protein